MRVATLFSGGKDSTLAAWVAEQHGWEVSHLVAVRSRSQESYMFHVPNVDLTPALAQAWGKPLVTVETAGEKERELAELEAALAALKREHGIEGIVSGALASEYQRTRLEGVGHRVGVKTFTPLWHKPQEQILDAVVRGGWDVRFSAVAAEGLTEDWLGARLTAERVERLLRLRARYGINVAGEGGEYESLVLWAPFWKHRVGVARAEAEWRRDHGVWRVLDARPAAPLFPKSI